MYAVRNIIVILSLNVLCPFSLLNTTYWLTVRSLQGNLILRFPCNDRTDKVNKLFIIWPFLWQWQIMDLRLQSIKTNDWSADIFKKNMSLQWVVQAYDTVIWHRSVDTLLNSCHLTITWVSLRMSTVKLNTDCICLGHLASNAGSLQENLVRLAASQSGYYYSHIIMYFSEKINRLWQ